MNENTSTTTIHAFLEDAKSLIVAGRCDFVPRRKNMQALALHGLTIQDAKEEILALLVGDYYKGPKLDFDRPGEIWEFKKKISGSQFYIKLKIMKEDGEDVLKCLGFHDDDFA